LIGLFVVWQVAAFFLAARKGGKAPMHESEEAAGEH